MSKAPADTRLVRELESGILDAHASDDRSRLARLYRRGAEIFAEHADTERAAFYYVNAYVFALDAGDDEVSSACHTALLELGREE